MSKEEFLNYDGGTGLSNWERIRKKLEETGTRNIEEFNEKLNERGKCLDCVSHDEFVDLAHEAGMIVVPEDMPKDEPAD